MSYQLSRTGRRTGITSHENAAGRGRSLLASARAGAGFRSRPLDFVPQSELVLRYKVLLCNTKSRRLGMNERAGTTGSAGMDEAAGTAGGTPMGAAEAAEIMAAATSAITVTIDGAVAP